MTVTMPVNGVASKIDDIRESLSKEAEHLADLATSYGRDASAHASDIADDAAFNARAVARNAKANAGSTANDQIAHANSWLSDILKAAAGLGTALALSGRKTADDLNQNAQSTAKDLSKNAQSTAKDLATELRKVRITTEPKKTGPDFTPGVTLLAGFGAGIALMWFLDPERGRARRNLLRDKLTSWTRKATETASGTARDLSNRAQGAAYEARKQMMPSSSVDGSAEFDADSDTQTWKTTAAYDSSQPQESDGSTTDTWGEQPQTTTPTTY
jgi:hypothetical protein